MGVTQISSFQGKTADGIKGYLSMVHGKIISSYMESTELLKGQFQKQWRISVLRLTVMQMSKFTEVIWMM